MKMISELKVKVAALTSELIEYKSVRGQLRKNRTRKMVIFAVSSVAIKIRFLSIIYGCISHVNAENKIEDRWKVKIKR